MCRIFGFRSVIQSQVHESLVNAENALGEQSREHPHGWGVAYYLFDTPHLIKSADTAVEDQIFQRVSGVVASQTVLAHVRRATVGDINILNAHPFQFGRWVFAHNGTTPAFPEVREALMERILPRLRRYVLGDTDSEVLFHLFLTHLDQHTDLERRGTAVKDIVQALRQTTEVARELADGRITVPPDSDDTDVCVLTMVVTDGQSMVAVRQGKELCFSTHKERCVDRETCTFLAPECEAPSQSGFVSHLLVSSEPLQGDNVWIELEEGEYVAVDWRMQLHRGFLREGNGEGC